MKSKIIVQSDLKVWLTLIEMVHPIQFLAHHVNGIVKLSKLAFISTNCQPIQSPTGQSQLLPI